LLDAKLKKEAAFSSLEDAQKSKAAANLVKENSQQTLNDLLSLVSFYDQKRALTTQQMQVCNQCPKMKEYQDANKDAAINYEKYKAQYTLAEMAMKNADLGVTNASISSRNADLQASRGVESVTSLTQDLAAAEKTCDDKFPEEAAAKAAYQASEDAQGAFERQSEAETKAEVQKLLKDRHSRSYYLSMRAGAHVDLGTIGFDTVADAATGVMTASCWVKLGALSRPMALMSVHGENAGEVLGWTLGVSPEDGFFFDVSTEGSGGAASERTRALSSKDALPSTKIHTGTWYFVAVTWGEESKLWVNGYNVARSKGGVIVYQTGRDDAGAGTRSGAGRRLTIGALPDGKDALTGGIDDVGIWAREATGDELQAGCNKHNSTALAQGQNNENLVAMYDFGPNFDLGTRVVGSTVAQAAAPEGTVVGNTTATWIPDDDSKVFCGKLSNTLGRKLIRRLSSSTARAAQTDDAKCKPAEEGVPADGECAKFCAGAFEKKDKPKEAICGWKKCGACQQCKEKGKGEGEEDVDALAKACPNALCQPRTEGGVALFLEKSLFGASAGQIPKLEVGKKLTKAQLLLSLAVGKVVDSEAVEEWAVEAFSMPDGQACAKDSVVAGAGNGTVVRIGPLERQNGRVMVDITRQLRALAMGGAGAAAAESQRGLFFTRTDPAAADSGVKFWSSRADKPENRPQLIAGITDGSTPPVHFEEGADALCAAPRKMCLGRELEMAAGFDGYSERACGFAVRGQEKAATRLNRGGRTEPCDEVKGVFCCNQNVAGANL
jgi:hypothetical protein